MTTATLDQAFKTIESATEARREKARATYEKHVQQIANGATLSGKDGEALAGAMRELGISRGTLADDVQLLADLPQQRTTLAGLDSREEMETEIAALKKRLKELTEETVQARQRLADVAALNSLHGATKIRIGQIQNHFPTLFAKG